jgi:hypothetical protein
LAKNKIPKKSKINFKKKKRSNEGLTPKNMLKMTLNKKEISPKWHYNVIIALNNHRQHKLDGAVAIIKIK